MTEIEKTNHLIIETDEGKKITMEILFTFKHPETKVNYVFYFEPSSPDDVFVSRYDDKGELFDLDDDEFLEADDVVENYLDEIEQK
jgi:uncharacterized protein YrzB (UPF0473 family)